jgi:dipeptidyl aminopeptidase/acylaminoacyl peptidase
METGDVSVSRSGVFRRWRLLPLILMAVLLSSCQARSKAQPLSIPHPSDPSRQVEYYIEKPLGAGPWPTVVLLHGHQDYTRPGARDFIDWGVLSQFAKRGYLAVAVSQPGYGNSTGPADFCGPITQQAVSGVLARLRKDGLASPTKAVIQGISRGAVVAALVAADDPSITGIVLISGIYDFPAYVAGPQSTQAREAIVNAIKAETGGSAEALRVRSALHVVERLKAATLILSGAKDDRADADQARRFGEELSRRGKNPRVIVYPDYGHQIPIEVRRKEIDPFIDQVLSKSSGASCE